ncbi:MAG: DUF4440 domain-containing protein [Betaproteobacteria bacterium]|nr:DUF4440 domain-containing protein [Betaproteobacteria bacterium]
MHSLRDDFFEFGSSGGIINKEMVLAYLGAETIDMTSVDFTLHVLADGVALLTYRSLKRFGGAKPLLYSNRSSIWTCTNGDWQMFFHQGTPAISFEFDVPGSHQLKR